MSGSSRLALSGLLVKVKATCPHMLLWVGFALFLAGICLTYYFDQTRPDRPNPGTGQIYQLINHGHFIYLTALEYWVHFGLLTGGVVVSAVGIYIGKSRARL